jgi:NAD(P)-dependent dehydrogenase (short-subunit alcohol dehydrogenase family)
MHAHASAPEKGFFVDLELSGRRILVTGAGRGLGRAIAQTLAREGAQVIAAARTASELESLARMHPGQIEPWPIDVTEAAFYAGVAEIDGLYGLVNNAGGNQPQPFLDVETAVLDRLIDLNIRAAFLCAQAAARAIARTGRGGAIINMSSQMGHVGGQNRSVYCMTKHALEGLTKAMALDLAAQKIRAVSVCPTFIETPLTAPMLADPAFKASVLAKIPLGRTGEMQEVADAVAYLISPRASLVTGAPLLVDGGWTAQ